MKVCVIEYDHGDYAHGVQGVARTAEEAMRLVRERITSVKWDEPQPSALGGLWLLRGTWHDNFREGPQFVTYRFSEHELAD